MAVSLSYTPTPSTRLGLTAPVAPSWGGRPGDERGRGAVGPGDASGAGVRLRRRRHPARCGGRLRAASGQPLRLDAAVQRLDLRTRAGLPAWLQARRRGSAHQCAAPGEPRAGRHGSVPPTFFSGTGKGDPLALHRQPVTNKAAELTGHFCVRAGSSVSRTAR